MAMTWQVMPTALKIKKNNNKKQLKTERERKRERGRCVCVCVWEGGGGGVGDGERERDRERVKKTDLTKISRQTETVRQRMKQREAKHCNNEVFGLPSVFWFTIKFLILF